jgi:hypothetical protein
MAASGEGDREVCDQEARNRLVEKKTAGGEPRKTLHPVLKCPGTGSHGDRFARIPLLTLFSLRAEQNFALSDGDIVERKAVFVGAGGEAGADGAARETNAGRGLQHVGGERAPGRVEFDLQISSVGYPANLIAGIEHHDIGHHSHQHRFFGQSFVLVVARFRPVRLFYFRSRAPMS